ncbi:MAG: hypothetical protein V3T58_02440 [Candidatus Hydrothermarchaeales archaeon]
MTTTIQVSKTTIKVLKKIKGRYKLESYDRVIERLVEEAMHPKKSLFGVLGKKSRTAILEGLRDEEDRKI